MSTGGLKHVATAEILVEQVTKTRTISTMERYADSATWWTRRTVRAFIILLHGLGLSPQIKHSDRLHVKAASNTKPRPLCNGHSLATGQHGEALHNILDLASGPSVADEFSKKLILPLRHVGPLPEARHSRDTLFVPTL